MAKLIHNLTNSPNLVERIKGIDRDIDTLNAKVGSIPEGMDVGQSIIDLQDNKQDKLTAGEGISIENNVISNTQRPAEWGNITGDITDQVDLQNELSSISDSIPTKTSDLTNDSGFITNSVNDLVNYYLKSETYTKTEVNNLIGSIQSFHYEIYPTIGSITTPLSNVLYLIGPTGTGSDRYEEYVYSNNNFVKIGETSIDLSGYVTIDNLNNALSNYTTTANLTTLLAQKQDMLTAGAGISISNNVISNTIPGATISNTAPSDPTQGMLRYDTVNDVLKSYDGNNWNEVGNESSDINTKAFYLSGTSDLTNAQAAYDWFSAGKNPIVMYNNRAYLVYAKNATQLVFQDIENSAYDQYSYTEYVGQKIIFTLSGNDVTAINYNSTSGWSGPILRTDVNYSTPYTPTYAGSPTTKQYVDNNNTYIGASAPTDNVVEGRLWYDITNDVLKVYDGTNWNEVGGDTYTAGNGINIDQNNEISVDTSVVATQTDLASKQDTLTAGTGIDIDANNEISVDTTVVATQTDLQNGLDEKQDKLTAGDNITIGDECTTESDMKGPAPSGFHVPLNTEWQAVYNIWTALGGGSSDGTNFGIALKLPFAGNRNYSSAGVNNQGTYGGYWSSSRYNARHSYSLRFNSTALYPQDYNNRAYGFTVRCFKDTPTIPTSSWTKLYGTSIEAGGIFWSSTDGLISLSSNGTTWITIADKNLGATTVWNSGDTLSETNCGKYYQWGNNYGFPRTGTIANQNTTQVDASNYGPGNYYSSDTFIKNSGSWDSTDNGNLWGGVTQSTFQDCIHNVISAENTTYTAGNNIDITNGVISAENVIKTDTTNDTGFRIEDSNGNYIDTTGGMIDMGYESGNDFSNTTLVPGQGISSEIYIEGETTYERSQVQLTNTHISATFDYDNGGGDADTLQEDYAFFGSPIGTNENKIAKLGDIQKAISAGATAPETPTEGQLWYDTTNDILKVYNGSSWVEAGNGKQSFFKTQAEYDALPASKESDGNLYIIVDNHVKMYTWEELENIGSQNALQILNEHPKDYAEYYASTGDLIKYDYYEWFNNEHGPLNPLPEGKYVLRYRGHYTDCIISITISNLTESEISSVGFPDGYYFDEGRELTCGGSAA